MRLLFLGGNETRSVQSISGLDVFFVGLHCSLVELERRELALGHRRIREARADFQTVHGITTYDLELNSENSLEENVKFLIDAWEKRKRPSTLDTMIQEMNLQNARVNGSSVFAVKRSRFGGASGRMPARTPKSGYLSRKFPES